MDLDSARLEDVQAWLRKAELDLRVAEHLLSPSRPGLEADVVFHAQQAAEKALKAFLTLHDVAFRKTHSLEELGRKCQAIEPSLAGLVDQAAPLTEYAWKFRYPGEPEEPTRHEAEEALATARRVYEAILRRMPPEVPHRSA